MLRKEISKSLSKGMSNSYLKVTTEKTDILKTSTFKFKKVVTRSVLGQLQLTQMSNEVMRWSSRNKKEGIFLYILFRPKEVFFSICVLLQCAVY